MRKQSRRTVLASLGLLATTGAVNSTSAAGSRRSHSKSTSTIEETDWPTYRGDPGRSGSTVESAAPNGEYATEAWSLGEATMDAVNEPLVGQGTVFRTEVEQDAPLTTAIAAYDIGTGEQVWKHENPGNEERSEDDPAIGEVTTTPVVADGRLYVASYADDEAYGAIHALDVETGEAAWKRSSVRKIRHLAFMDGVLCTPTTAYNPATGEVVCDDPDGRVLGFADGSRYVVRQNELFVDDIPSGTDQGWTILQEVPGTVSSVIVDETAYTVNHRISDPDEVYAVSLSDGEHLWSWSLPDENDSQDLSDMPAVGDGTVVVAGNEPIEGDPSVEKYPRGTHTTVYALDAATGEVRWTHDTPTRIKGDPTIAGDTVYLGGHAWGDKKRDYANEPLVWKRYPTVEALALSDGSERWSYLVREEGETNKPWAETPVVADGKVFFKVTEDVDQPNVGLYALEASDTAPDAWNVPGTNDWPVARIRTDPEDAERRSLDGGTTVTLDGSASEGGIRKYEWRVGEGSSYDRTGEQIDVTLNFCGEIDVGLRVTGPEGRQNTASVTLSTV